MLNFGREDGECDFKWEKEWVVRGLGGKIKRI